MPCAHGAYNVIHRSILPLPFAGQPHSPTPYAFVRWFKHAPLRGDQLEAAGCKRVKYDQLPRSRGAYDVIHLHSIVCREHVVPDFKAEGFFYVSAFSPSRPK